MNHMERKYQKKSKVTSEWNGEYAKKWPLIATGHPEDRNDFNENWLCSPKDREDWHGHAPAKRHHNERELSQDAASHQNRSLPTSCLSGMPSPPLNRHNEPNGSGGRRLSPPTMFDKSPSHSANHLDGPKETQNSPTRWQHWFPILSIPPPPLPANANCEDMVNHLLGRQPVSLSPFATPEWKIMDAVQWMESTMAGIEEEEQLEVLANHSCKRKKPRLPEPIKLGAARMSKISVMPTALLKEIEEAAFDDNDDDDDFAKKVLPPELSLPISISDLFDKTGNLMTFEQTEETLRILEMEDPSVNDDMDMDSDDDDDTTKCKEELEEKCTGSRRPLAKKQAKRLSGELKKRVEAFMKPWVRDNWINPYLGDAEMMTIARNCGVTVKQVDTWLTNHRNRQWKTCAFDIMMDLDGIEGMCPQTIVNQSLRAYCMREGLALPPKLAFHNKDNTMLGGTTNWMEPGMALTLSSGEAVMPSLSLLSMSSSDDETKSDAFNLGETTSSTLLANKKTKMSNTRRTLPAGALARRKKRAAQTSTAMPTQVAVRKKEAPPTETTTTSVVVVDTVVALVLPPMSGAF